MTKVISVLNQKGGVGKTTISINIGVSLSKKRFKTLLVDSDPQASLRDWSEASGGELLSDNLSVIGLDRETLAKDIEVNKKGYDFVIIDGRAKAEKMAGAAIRASDVVLIPIAPSALDVWGASDLVDAIQARREITEGKPKAFFVLNQAKERTKLLGEVKPAAEELGFKVLDSVLYNREIYKQTVGEGYSVHTSTNKAAIKEVNNLIEELLEALSHESEAIA